MNFNRRSPCFVQVFFGREPWIVLCSNGESVDPVFEATSRKEKGVSFGVLDCGAQLPSKKSTFERLKLNANVPGPVLFFAGYGRDPKQLPTKLLRNQYVLRKELTALTKTHATKIKDTTQPYRKCLKKGKCGLVLAGGELDPGSVAALNEASDASPDFSWVILDASKFKLRKPSEKDIGLPKFTGTHRALLLKPSASQKGETLTLSAAPYLGAFAKGALMEFVEAFQTQESSDWKQVDSESLAIMKRKLAPQYRAASSSPSPEPEATVLPTAQVEENRKLASARRAAREAAKRAEMDAEAEDFIEYDGGRDEDDDEDEVLVLD